MAARTRRPFHDDRTREKIRTSQLVNLLQNDALGKLTITDGRRRSAEILLRKRLPDLAAVEHTGEMVQTYVAQMPAPVADLDAWKAQHMQPEVGATEPIDPTKH